MTEKLALDQLFGNGGAVDLDEGPVVAQTLLVDAAGDQFLTRTVLAGDQHAAVARGGLGNETEKLPDRFAVAHDLVLLLDLRFEGANLLLELSAAERVRDGEQNPLERKRLFHEVRGAQAHGLHRRFDRSMARDHDHGQIGVDGLNPVEGLDAIDAGQPHVEQHQFIAVRFHRLDPGLARLDRIDAISLVGQDAGERGPDSGLVVNDQDAFAHLGSSGSYQDGRFLWLLVHMTIASRKRIDRSEHCCDT